MWAPVCSRRSGPGPGPPSPPSPSHGPTGSSPSPCPSPSPLGPLLQLGVPRHRALKALAATGNKSVQLASDWLLTHVGDSTLDNETPREYVLYACPTGLLADQLRIFWNHSLQLCGRNGAHNFTPHITLVSFFKAPDECAQQLSKVLKRVVDAAGEPPERFPDLEPYVSPNFMGLFVSDEHAEYFKNIAVQYVKQVSTTIGLTVDTYEQLDALATCFPWCAVPQEPPQPSICLEPHVKSLHITLAYQFASAMYSNLKGLTESLQPLEKAPWEIRLYSRDTRLATHEVYKVKHVYSAREKDELELRMGDYIYVEENVVKNSPDGWVPGISWLTGMTGYLPINYTERTAESDAWTLHKSVILGQNSVLISDNKIKMNIAPSNDSLCKMMTKTEVDTTETENPQDINKLDAPKWNPIDLKDVIQSLHSQCYLNDNNSENENDDISGEIGSIGSTRLDNESDTQTRDIFVMRHGERVDFTFGSWVPYCFDDEGNYIRKDLNMPASLPYRSGGSLSYMLDCPLTRVGLLQAKLVGEGLKMAGTKLTHVYSSPSYRCLQTTQAMLEGLECDSSIKIRVEPSLFEWLIWYSKGPPNWMTVDELHAAKFNVDTKYEPFMSIGETPFIQTTEDSECLEDCNQFYERNARFVDHALKATEIEGGSIMLVGHASTLDTAWRGLSGLGVRDCNSLGQLMRGVPYCSLALIRGPPWQLAPPPCPPLMHSSNKRFDWKILKED